MQAQRRVHEISHFRAPYKDSIMNGYGVYEQVSDRELHGVGEYLPVSGMGEYMPVSGFGDDAAPAATAAVPLIIFQVVGHLQYATDAGAAAIATMLAPYQGLPNAIAAADQNGDVSVVAWIGPGAPPADMGPGPFATLAQIFAPYMTGGWVVLSDTTQAQPVAGKRSWIITKNPDTIAKQARVGGLYFLSPGADATLAAQANQRVLGNVGVFANLGSVGTAAVLVAVGAAIWLAIMPKKGGKGRK